MTRTSRIRGLLAAHPPARCCLEAEAAFRFGVPSGDHAGLDDPLFTEAIERLRGLGGTCQRIDFTPFVQAGGLLYGAWVAERFADLGDFLQLNVAEINPVVYDIILGGAKYSAADLFRAQHQLQALRRQVAGTFEAIDVLLVPTAPVHPTHEDVARDPVGVNAGLGYYTTFCNLLDLCAVAIPGGVRPNGLPFGVQVVAPAFSDAGLLSLCERFERFAVGV